MNKSEKKSSHEWSQADLFKVFRIVDPKEVAYTVPSRFILHSSAHRNAVTAGDSVQIYLRSPGEDSYGLSVWMKVTSANGEKLAGTLERLPVDPGAFEIPSVPEGTVFRLNRSQVCRVRFADPKKSAGLPPANEYWDRGCIVHESVLKRVLPVQYMYREKPSLALKDDLPDSGWRMTFEKGRISDEEILSGKVGNVPLAVAAYFVCDGLAYAMDYWLAMIDEPLGAAFEKNPETGLFTRQSRNGG